MRAYKFLPARFAEALLCDGNVRIGSVAEYRVADGFDGGRADESEGIIDYTPGAVVLTGAKLQTALTRLGLGSASGLPAMVFDEGGGFYVRMHGNIFCASTKLTPMLVRRMASDFGCDACVRINDVKEFARRVSAAVPALQVPWPSQFSYWAAGPITYRQIDQTAELPDGNIFTKMPKFRWQNEMRIAWIGTPPNDPIIATVPAIRELLSSVDLDSWR